LAAMKMLLGDEVLLPELGTTTPTKQQRQLQHQLHILKSPIHP